MSSACQDLTHIDVVRHTIPADVSLAAPLRQHFIREISGTNIPDADVHRWELVFQELVVNAICHGAADDPSHTITAEWSIATDSVTIAVQDPGNGPPDHLLENPPPPDPESFSGRGIFIVSQFADRLRWWRGPAGFRIEVLKHHPGLGLHLPENPELDSVLEELSSCYESLSTFRRLTENLIANANLRDFISHSLDEFMSLHPHDRIFIQGSPSIPENLRQILSPATWFLDPNDANHTLKTIGLFTRETVWEDAADLARQHPSSPPLRTLGAGCVFPVVAGNIHFGALIVLRKNTAPDNRFRSLGTLRTLADLCGIACANAHLSAIRDEAQRDLRELEIAVAIQKSLLPILPPPLSPAWSISIHQESALTIAGDYAIARTDPAGNLAIAIIDVMGKGVSAALLASVFRTAFEMSLHIPSAAAMLQTINLTLCNQLGDLTMFITCAIARIPADAKSLDHASAGHCPTFLYDRQGNRRFLRPSGPPLGILADTSYSGETVPLLGGERIVFVTDGCFEWDRGDHLSGWDEFVRHIDHNVDTPAAILWSSLRDRIRSHCGQDLEDDCTLITLDITP